MFDDNYTMKPNDIAKSSYAGYELFTGSLNDIPYNDKILVNTINQYSYCIAETDSEFKNALKHSEILLPDGIAVVVAVRLLTGKKIRKISGADLHQHLLSSLNKKAGRCFYLGSSPATLDKIKNRLKDEYPAISAGFYSPPYKSNFLLTDNKEMLKAVNDFKPDVLFVGMTAPKQEKWAFDHKEALDANIICSIGAVFDFYAGTVNRPGKIWINLGLEWLGRLLSEPKRLWKRYLYYGPVFIYAMMKQKFSTATIK